jgi:hypothetical protein
MKDSSIRIALLLSVLALAATGCAHVPAYDRAVLAQPSMSSGILAGPGEAHLWAIHEGATGGTIGAESGCGCN